jgi:hypothetical protein
MIYNKYLLINEKKQMEYKTNTEHLLGKDDKILQFYSKWPIYKLNNFKNNCLWKKFQNKLLALKEKDILKNIEDIDIVNYFTNNPDIDFETLFFQDSMPKQYIFKINNNVFSYTFGYASKRKFIVRFYFDLNQFFSF